MGDLPSFREAESLSAVLGPFGALLASEDYRSALRTRCAFEREEIVIFVSETGKPFFEALSRQSEVSRRSSKRRANLAGGAALGTQDEESCEASPNN